MGNNLTYEEEPICIVDVRTLRNQMIPMVKVLWQHHSKEEAIWEHEDIVKGVHHQLFQAV